MSRYTHLTIFQKSFDLMVRIYAETHKFPKAHKYLLGEKINGSCLNVLDAIISANSEHDKLPHVRTVCRHIELLRIYIRLSYALHIIGVKKYEVLSKYTDEVGRLAGGWLKTCAPDT